MLTNYNGTSISYDGIGNPLNWRNATSLTWQGRRLTAMVVNGTAMSFEYNSDGIRQSKTYGNTTVNYITDGSKIIAENRNGTYIYYVYDEKGAIMGMMYNNQLYTFRKNLQGDVTGIYTANGNLVVEYTYSPYGEVLSVTGTLASTIGTANPFRYRGYYYDTETGFYYVSSRYYDPEIGRWISPEPNVNYGEFDEGAGLLGYNVYSYCANNPVMFKDETGEGITLACVLIGAGIGLIVGAVGGSHYAKHKKNLTPSDGWDYWKYVVYGGVAGGVLGGLAGWAFAGTNAAASISWAYYKATNVIGTSAYAIGSAFEKWFYRAYNIVKQCQQVSHKGYRFDAIFKNSIVELKNYNWSNYSSYNSLIRSFTNQARNYMQFIGDVIRGQEIKGVTFCFSSKPPQVIIDALRNIGVTVNWLK